MATARALVSLFTIMGITLSAADAGPLCFQPFCKDERYYHPDAKIDIVKMFVENHGWDVSAPHENPSKIYRELEFHRAWLEFKDDGKAFAQDQKESIVRKLGEFRSKKEAIFVSVYIHGWHHNADPNDGNVKKFNYFMARQIEQIRRLFEQRGSSEMPTILGIYVGWRGESNSVPYFNVATIGNRAEGANRVGLRRGKDSLHGVLKEIGVALRDADPQGKLLVTGHSLGGRIVARMVLEEFVAGDPRPFGPNSLLVALEPAVGADCYDGVLGKKWSGVNPAPTFLNITSADDNSIRDYYPWSIYIINDCSGESKAAGVTVGSYEDYLTHKITFKQERKGKYIPESPPFDDARAFTPLNSNKNWFQAVGNRTLAYTMRQLNPPCVRKNPAECYDLTDTAFYTMTTAPQKGFDRVGPVWNILTDRNTINTQIDADTTSALHNGYISVNLSRLIAELLYAGSTVTSPAINR